MNYFNEFILIAVAMQMALISPGPDLMVTLKQTINYGKKYAYISSVGIGFGILVHLLYTFLGLELILRVFPQFLTFMKICGALYLIYLGISSFKNSAEDIKIVSNQAVEYSYKKSFITGFVCNVLNPKATLFFVSIFTTIVDINTPFYIQSVYILYCILATIFWFMLIANILSRKNNMDLLNKYRSTIDKSIGAVLILLGLAFLF